MQLSNLLKNIKNKYSISVVFAYAAILIFSRNSISLKLGQSSVNKLSIAILTTLLLCAAYTYAISPYIKEKLANPIASNLKYLIKIYWLDLTIFILFSLCSFLQARAYLESYQNILPNHKFIISLGKIGSFIDYFSFANLVGILAATTIGFSYIFFRQTLERFMSVILTILLLSSALQLDHLVPYWNKYYIRAPILIIFLSILTNLVRFKKSILELRVIIPVLGIILGIGMIFRPGLFLFSFLVYATIFFLLPNKNQIPLRDRFVLILLFYTFYSGTYSIKKSFRFQNQTSHAFLGGTTPFFDARLGLQKPNYDLHYLHLDEYTTDLACANSKKCRENRELKPMEEHFSPEAQNAQMKRSFLYFPADAVIRFVAATFRVLEVPFTYTLPAKGLQKESKWFEILNIRNKLLKPLNNTGLFWGFSIFLILGLISPIYLIYFLLMLTTLCILPFIHIIGYYFFYMEFVGLWCFGASLETIVRFTKSLLKKKKIPKFNKIQCVNLTITFLLFLLPIFLLLLARIYQKTKVEEVIAIYDKSEKAELPYKRKDLPRSRTLITNSDLFKQGPKPTFKIHMLEATFSNKTCGRNYIFPILRYRSTSVRMDWSRSLRVQLSSKEPTKVYFPVFIQNSLKHDSHNNFFEGIELSKLEAECFLKLSTLSLEQLPFLLNFQMPLLTNPYKIFDFEKNNGKQSQNSNYKKTYLTDRNSIPLSNLVKFNESIISIQGHIKDTSSINKYFPIQGPPWTLAKYAYPNAEALLINTDLLVSAPIKLKSESIFFTTGELRAGGAMFILFDEFNNVVERKTLTQSGGFKFSFQIPRAGTYQLGVTNYLAFYQTLENSFEFSAYWGQKQF